LLEPIKAPDGIAFITGGHTHSLEYTPEVKYAHESRKPHSLVTEEILRAPQDEKVNDVVALACGAAHDFARVAPAVNSSSTDKAEEHFDISSDSFSMDDASDASSVSGEIASCSNSRTEYFALEHDEKSGFAELLGFDGQVQSG